MSVSFENTATNRGVVTFTIGQDKIQPALDQAFNKVKKNLNAPGFRKGHMPRAVFNQKFGEEALYDDALNAILPAAYEAAIAELGLDVVAQPKIDVKSIEKGQDWTLTAEVVTKPEVKLGAYKDLEVSVEASKEVPALDDELAKDLDDEVETLDELKAKYRKELEAAKEIAYDDAVEGAALDLAVENAEIVELPAEMVEDEVHRAMNEFMGNMQRQGISPEMYFQITGTTQEDLHKQYEAEAESRTKTNLVVEAVAKAEGFEATEEEINAEIEQLAADYNMPVEQVRNLLSPEMLKHDITVKKAVNVITSTAKVK